MQLIFEETVRPSRSSAGPDIQASGHYVQLAQSGAGIKIYETIAKGSVLSSDTMQGARENYEDISQIPLSPPDSRAA